MQPEEATKMPYRLLHGWPVRVRCCRPACLAIATDDDDPAGRLAHDVAAAVRSVGAPLPSDCQGMLISTCMFALAPPTWHWLRVE